GLFPSGQLVTSPAQEQAKILYLKEQLLEKMLRGMDGVVSAQVSIAESVGQHRREPPSLSASVFIKHSPEVNLANREAD
ncbi:MAG: EscJ/YscJ/HrcJ family type III secretion inner membrane ring protein, partial [Microvirgula sp.]